MRTSIPALAIKRPITVTMMMVTLIIFGVIATRRLPLEFLPPMELPFLGCFISYPGATPVQVEEEIAIVAEGEFRTLSNLKNLYTFSNDGGCFVSFNFDWGTDMNEATAEVRDRIERLRLVLPEGADRVFIQNWNSGAMPIMEIGVSNTGDFKEFAHRVRTILLPRLQRLEGVAEVQMWGAEEESVLVEFDQNKLRAFDLSIFDIIQTLQSSNLNVSVGELTEGGTRYLVRALGEHRSPEDLEDVIVSPGIRVKDIATAGYQARETDWLYEIDGNKEIFLMLTKEAGANTVSTCENALEEFQAALKLPEFKGTTQFVFMNQADIILGALSGLVQAGKWGAILSIAIIFLFLGRIIPTLAVSIAIPASLVTGIIVLYFAGMSLNLVTMMSMIIAVGMVVDNAIVVVENIYRYRRLGYNASESALRGSNEVAMAITCSTLTSVVVFVPVLYMDGGQMSVFLQQFALPVAVSMGASLVFAVTVIPLFVSRVGHGEAIFFRRLFRRQAAPLDDQSEARGGILFRPIEKMVNSYGRSLELTLNWRLLSFIVIAAIVWLTVTVPGRNVGMQAMPEMDRRMVDIDIHFDPNYDMASALEVTSQIEAVVEKRRGELGIKNIFKNVDPRSSELELFLIDADDLAEGEEFPYTTEQVRNILWEVLPERIPGARIRLDSSEGMPGGGGGGGGMGQSRLSLRFQGDDAETLERYAERLMALMETIPGLTEIEDDTQPAEKEFQLDIDEVLAEKAGVSPTVVAQTVGFALMGTRLQELKQGGREIDVWAQFREEDRESRANLDNVMIMGMSGTLTPLNQLVRYSKADSPQNIERLNGKNYLTITAKTAEADITKAQAELQSLIDGFDLPTGYSISFGDELMEMQESMGNFTSALGLGVVLIYVVMAALFESWLLPLSILTTVPLAFLGVVWMMWITDTPLDTIAYIGMLLMVGCVVNNGIVIVDFINNLRKQGYSRFDAVVQAGKDRLRPVLMTAITTILGAVPMAIGGGVGGDSVASMGRALIGGMMTGTFLTLLVVPLFYTLIDDVQIWFGRFFANIMALGKPRGISA